MIQEIRVGGGSKNLAIRRGGGGFFWNNPLTINVKNSIQFPPKIVQRTALNVVFES